MDVSVSKEVNAPIERVFDVFSDLTKTEERIEAITKLEILSDVKQGKGTRWRETRVMFGREATEEMEISVFEPNKSYEVVAESRGMKYHSVYSFAPQGDATRVDMTFSGTPMTFAAKLMSPIGSLFKGTVRKALEADMEQLKTVCEAGSQ